MSKFTNFFKNNLTIILKITLISTIILAIALVIIFVITKLNKNEYDNVYKNRTQRCLEVYNNYTLINQKPIPNGGKYFNSYFKKEKYYGLRDFYYACSYKSYLPCGYSNDVVSYNALSNVLYAGARAINLDIFYDGPYPFANESKIIVGNVIDGKLAYLPKTSTDKQYLEFINCLEIIDDIAWKKTDAPLFLYLNLEFKPNQKLEYQIFSQLFTKLKQRFLDKYYSFQRVNIGDIPVNQALNKIIILTNRKPICGFLNEITNGLMSPESTNLILFEITDGDTDYGGVKVHFAKKEDALETTQFNLTAVIKKCTFNENNFSNPKIDTNNYNTDDNFELGVSMCFMNWQNYPDKDDNMKKYLEKFKDGGMILKPPNLIYEPRPKPPAIERNTKFDYINRNVSGLGGFYNFNT